MSRGWRKVLGDDVLWKDLLQRDYGVSASQGPDGAPAPSFRSGPQKHVTCRNMRSRSLAHYLTQVERVDAAERAGNVSCPTMLFRLRDLPRAGRHNEQRHSVKACLPRFCC